MPIHFDNRGLECIHSIPYKKDIKYCLAESLRENEIPSTVYSLSNTIRNKIFNYYSTVKNINTNDTRTYGTGIILCNCTNSKYLNHHHGHIIPRDLQIIENKKLGNILSKGPNSREPKTISWKKSKESIAEGLDNLIKGKLLYDKMISEESLILWQSAILAKVDNNFSKLKTRIKPSKSNPILKKMTSQVVLKHSKKFVLVPFDKASNDVAIICKRYYVEVILNEIGVIGHGNNTHGKANISCDEIIDENTDTKRLGFKITKKEKTLVIMYWIPQMHKNPTGARFIIASKICFTKQFSKFVSNIFKLVYYQIENFHKNAKFLSNYNKFWVL